MPTYNHARFIGAAVESVLQQTFTAWELVVVDDGSDDGTPDIVRGFRDDRIKLICREHRGLTGLRDAYETALARSTAPLIAILEGDDRWPPDKLSRQVPDFDRADVVLSYGLGELIDACGIAYGLVEPPITGPARENVPTGSILPSLLATNFLLSPTVMVRRAALDAIGGFWQPDGVPFVDHPTWLLLAQQGRFAYQPAVVGSWRRHRAQWTTRAVAGATAAHEEGYLRLVVERLVSASPSADSTGERLAPLIARHRDRALLNSLRMALLSDDPSGVLRTFLSLVRTARPRLVASALLGALMWSLGSDLEWLQRRRHGVAWPSRRHVRDHPCADSPGATI
jgi:glycosyltransferase involved in cell wall biosynthesis